MEYKTGYDTGTYETFEEGICPHQTRDRRGCAYRGPGPWDGACPYLNNPDIRCHIKNCIDETREAGISKQGPFILKVRTRKTRTVLPEKFFARFGTETFVACSTIAIGKAEAAVGKGTFDDCCEIEVKETGVSVEYVRPEGRA